jgi:hypothetical protein
MLPVSLDCFVFLPLVYPILQVSLDCFCGTQDEEKQSKNNPEKLAT